MRAYLAAISVWSTVVAFVVARAWRRVYVLDEFNDKFGKAGTFALTWEPALIVLGLSAMLLALVVWLFRSSRTLTSPARGLRCGLMSLVIAWLAMKAKQMLFHQFEPLSDNAMLGLAVMISILPISVTFGFLMSAKGPNKTVEDNSVRAQGNPGGPLSS